VDTGYAGRQIVGLDLHRRRSVFVRMDDTGERLGVARVVNDPYAFADQIAKMGEHPQVVLEATYGWYWAVDLLQDAGAEVHLAHPLGVKGFAYRRVKNDERDAADLADLLRMHRLPEAWIAPPGTRELRELVRHRAKLVALRSGLKCGVHAVLAKCGISVAMSDLFGVAGAELLDRLHPAPAYRVRIASLRTLISGYDSEIDTFTKMITARLVNDPGWKAVQAIEGVGPVLASVFVAEIGDVTRFTRPEQLCSWAGMTPKHRESDTKIRRGRITKQGNHLVRWAAVEAVQRIRADSRLGQTRARIEAHRGAGISKVATARKLLTLVFYGLRDGHIRCLAKEPA
jgi:transposase